LILICVVLTAAAAAFYTSRQVPMFDASASIRVQDREPNLPDIYRSIASGGHGELETEMGVLGSRALKEDAAATLGLQLYLADPGRVARATLLQKIIVSPNAQVVEYRLARRPDGRFDIFVGDSAAPVGASDQDGTVRLRGVTFTLTPAAAHYDHLVVGVQSLSDAVGRLAAVSIAQPDRNASILTVSYSDADSLIVREVPNLITSRYLARRQRTESAQAGSTAEFLREQLRRVSTELDQAEEAFRSFRERQHVIDPSVETSSGVSRLISKQAERTTLEAERQALSTSLAEIEATPASPGGASPYRRLIGLPFLLRNEAASTLLNALVTAENEKAAMVTATAQDPDMRVLQSKITALEGQLRTITETYLQGLRNQVASLDGALDTYGRELNTIPRKELEYARLERNVKGLEGVYTLLQTRLNEAEIAVAAKDASIEVVDSAVTPTAPSTPQPLINLAAALAAGLMLGIGIGFVRDYQDKSVHSRHDVVVATGIAVLALIPRIPKARGRVALIAGRRRLGSGESARRRRSSGRPKLVHGYAFVKARPGGDEPRTPASAVESGRVAGAPSLELTVSPWTTMVAEAYGLLIANVSFAQATPTKVLVITSPLAEDGKTTCAVNLAITLAMRGSKTLLIDADLRRGVIHTALGTDRSPGLSDVLSRSYPVDEAVRAVKVGEQGGLLHFLTTGPVPPNPSALLESSDFRALVQRMKAEFDYVIIDSPPANIISDASILGHAADGVLVVARSGVTESSALSHAVEHLTRVGVPLLGVVLNDIDFKRDIGYDASYRAYAANQYLSAPQGS
jgi:tyrosine-protein kinase Etk/Wzc